MKRVLTVLLALAMTLSLFACNNDANSPSNDDTPNSTVNTPAENNIAESVTVALRKNSWDLAPFNGSGSARQMMWHQLYATLLACPYFGAPYEELELDMAKSVSFSDDNLTATVELHDYIKDNQGNPIKASDVVFSYKTACEASGYTKVASYLKDIVAVGDYVVELQANITGVGIWELVLSNVPVINQEWFERTTDDEKSNNPAVTGAYYVVSNTVGSNVEFKLVEDFWQKDELRTCYQKATVETIYYDCITEESMRTIAIETGEVDATLVGNSSIGTFLDNDNYTVLKFANSGSSTLLFNCKEGGLFEDENLRKGILHAVDWEQARLAAGGTAEAGGVAHDFCAPCASDYNETWDSEDYFGYNIDTATKYLNEAGVGTSSGMNIRVMCGNDTYKGAATVIQSYLKKVGINVEILSYDAALFNTYLYEDDQWDIVLTSATTSGYVVDTWNYAFSEISDKGTLGFVKDDKLQELLTAASTVHDAESIDEFHYYLMDKAYGMAMYYDESYLVAQSGITNLYLSHSTDLNINSCTFANDFVSTAGK